MALLVKSTRVSQDLTKIASFGATFTPDSAIVVREWHPEVPKQAEMEFRGFVYKNQLNAISQYDDMTFVERIVENRERLAELMRSFFAESIRDSLAEHENYIIDFFVDFDHGQVKVIELNPFHIGAGAALFSWKEHRELFMNGPFEFRVVEKVKLKGMELLPAFWEKTLKAIVEEVSTEFFPKKGGCIIS